ncbi:acyl-CoA desaturase [Micromonospora olivasterospora]|uniref:Stearoyl-CoA desaturase (Delta-9 desaturase) n=1 Tax=Micromonospora olivasterospora TaxID=1880 RepID=A0A562I8X3_MICOL|nr:acyl-CoA desaturase [Micromonospora olivasterospora]TWH67175.1 stearoyl-CoA desaturase (delta-9 desaturase) [Micromonospora olivasterospora]
MNLAEAGIVRLDPQSLRIKRFSALTTMTLPLIGTAVAVWLLVTGHVTALDLILFGVMYLVHLGGVTIGLHRLIAHRAFKTRPWVRDVLMVAGSMAAQGPLLFWVATHRRHHKFADQEGDPHSPNLHGTDLKARARGLWYAHMPWMLSEENSKWSVFAPDVLHDRRLVAHHRMYPAWVLLGLALPTAVGLVVGGSLEAAGTALVFGGLARIFVANQAAWCVGSICHAFGSRPFATRDQSTNNWWVAVVTMGEGLQNNHHAFPGSYRHAVRWWEPDLSGWLIAGLGRLRLAWDLHEPSATTVARRRMGD